ncbi:MAG: hypothetical protein KF745_14840 [Phycisphaeraceae bacterium]|nr:hypothetical protein [Phycisphaeraceae bacterium]
MFAADRDLLILEPSLFRDISFLAQRILETTGSTSGATLTITGDAASPGVTTGHVVLVGGVPLEVLARTTATVLEVSRPRLDSESPPVTPPTLTAQPVTVTTFLPQIALAHASVLRMIGVEPGDPAESRITNARSLRLLESLIALGLVYDAAAASTGPQSPAAFRAEAYRLRAVHERTRAVARLDLDGDGLPDHSRSLSAGRWTRA